MRRNMRDGTVARAHKKVSWEFDLKDECTMEPPASDRDCEIRHDHLVVFREFLDHLERVARRGASTLAKDRRSRTGRR
jgi:hypothetical protein